MDKRIIWPRVSMVAKFIIYKSFDDINSGDKQNYKIKTKEIKKKLLL